MRTTRQCAALKEHNKVLIGSQQNDIVETIAEFERTTTRLVKEMQENMKRHLNEVQKTTSDMNEQFNKETETRFFQMQSLDWVQRSLISAQ